MKTVWLSVLSVLIINATACRRDVPITTIDGRPARPFIDRCAVEVDGPGELCVLAGRATDKGIASHRYIELFEQLFRFHRNQPLRILEIGIAEGWSLRLWERYFPRAAVYGIDIDHSDLRSPRITTFVADQSDRRQLQKFLEAHGGDFNVIIDDGGHTMSQQQISFGHLFPQVVPGGYYIIEDVHTSLPRYSNEFGLEPDGGNSTLSFLLSFIRGDRLASRYLTAEENAFINDEIDYVTISARSHLVDRRNDGIPSIVAIVKRRPRFPAGAAPK
ncbi:MAG: class I SAM-dependent methyltransferase [Vicinamibacteria bacterium]|nr:class I SAM-dependent methyltransferase [Vicinamibacteria bacterium]